MDSPTTTITTTASRRSIFFPQQACSSWPRSSSRANENNSGAGRKGPFGRDPLSTGLHTWFSTGLQETDHDSSLTCFIVMETGESLEIEGLLPSTTIEELKEIIYDHNPKIPSKRQRLSYAGAPLAPDLTLSDYKIKNLCVINLDREFQRMAVMRKPVILLYPPNVLEDVSVRITLHSEMKFSALYPRPCKEAIPRSGEFSEINGSRQCEWRVQASPGSCLRDMTTNKEYPYLFWEAATPDGRAARSFNLSNTPSFCVSGDDAGEFLEDALTRLGLNARERCDMITYWLMELEAYPFNAIQFVDYQHYARSAKLDITPTPDVVIRVFMVFRGLREYDPNMDTAELVNLNSPSRQGFVAVEWGGMSLNKD